MVVKKEFLVMPSLDEKSKDSLRNSFPEINFTFIKNKDLKINDIKDKEVIIGNPPVDFLKQTNTLRWLQLQSSGIGGYGEASLQNNFILTTATGVYGPTVSEHGFAMLLSIFKKINLYRDNQKKSLWQYEGQASSLYNKKVIILGLGDIGENFAKLVSVFTKDIIGFNRSGRKNDIVNEVYTLESLDNHLKDSDIIFMALPESEETPSTNISDATNINITDDLILVEGVEISTGETSPVYLKKVVETHPDVEQEYKDVENQVIVITKSGDYSFSGTLNNGQIRVDTKDEDDVNIILNGLNITNQTAPAIYVKNANEKNIPNDGSVTIFLNKSTENTATGSNIAEYIDEDGETIKNGGAISSNVSLIIDGEGGLNLLSKNEGIEVKTHLTINNGNLVINSSDDALNTSEDGVSFITINGGRIYANANLGAEGDAIDSNGSLIINGGEIIAIGNEKSMDGGLDADTTIEINGGIVVATGNMYDEISSDSKQVFHHLSSSQAISKGTLVVIKDGDGNPVLAYKLEADASSIVLSSSLMVKGNEYTIHTGGEIDGTEVDGLYTTINSYLGGEIFTSIAGSTGGRGGTPPPAGGPPPTDKPPTTGTAPVK